MFPWLIIPKVIGFLSVLVSQYLKILSQSNPAKLCQNLPSVPTVAEEKLILLDHRFWTYLWVSHLSVGWSLSFHISVLLIKWSDPVSWYTKLHAGSLGRRILGLWKECCPSGSGDKHRDLDASTLISTRRRMLPCPVRESLDREDGPCTRNPHPSSSWPQQL